VADLTFQPGQTSAGWYSSQDNLFYAKIYIMISPGIKLILVIFSLFSTSGQEPSGCFPIDQLPSYITPLTSFGQRSEWGLDGQKVYFVDKAGGEVWMVDIRDKKPVQLSKPEWRPAGHGYYRVVCLSNGDFLLTCGPGRRETYIQILDKSLQKIPVSLDVPINEGPAVSRKNLKIAWSPEHVTIWTGRISYENGKIDIVDRKKVMEGEEVQKDAIKGRYILEPQNYRPPAEEELIWSQYGTTSDGTFSSEVMGLNLVTGETCNYSKAPEHYDEPEGIYPDGEFTLVESDRHNPKGTGFIDIYRLKLDCDDPVYERLTHFSEVKGFRSSNPVISDDGKRMAFQASLSGTEAGAGCGIYLFDLENRRKQNR
jgi:hypothetical protein